MRTGIVSVLVVVAFIMAGCLPVLVGGLIWHDMENEEQCFKLIRHPTFTENMKKPTFRAAFEDHCGQFDESDEWEAKAYIDALDQMEQEAEREDETP